MVRPQQYCPFSEADQWLPLAQHRTEPEKQLSGPELGGGNSASNSGFPNTAGMSASRNRNKCTRTPIVRPPSLLSGMIASAATCQVSATYANPGFTVTAVFS